MADGGAGLMGGIGSLAQGFLAGRQARIQQQQADIAQQQANTQQSAEDVAQQQQDLENQKYQFMKQQQAVANKQKDREQSIETFGAVSKGTGEAGSDVSNYLATKMPDIYGAQSQSQPSAQSQTPQDSPSDNSGFMNYQPGSGMLGNGNYDLNGAPSAQPQSQSAPQQGSPFSTVPSTNAQANPDAIPTTAPLMVRQAQMAQLKAAQDKRLDLQSSGGSAQVVPDGQGGYSLSGVKLGSKDQAQIASDISGSRSPKNTVADDFQKAATPYDQSAQYTEQAIANYNHRSPAGDAATALTAFRIKFPNTPGVNDIDELKKSPAFQDYIGSEFSKTGTGLYSTQVMNQLMQDIVTTNDANYKNFQGIKSDFQDRAKGSNVNDLSFLNKHAVDTAHSDGDQLLKNIGEYQTPIQRPGFLQNSSNFISGLIGNSQPSSASVNNGSPQTTFIPGRGTFQKVPGGWKRISQ